MPVRKFVYLVSLGCPKNLVDTEIITASFLGEGIGIALSPDEADAYLINTCAFIPPARDEAESVIRDAVQWKGKLNNRKIVVAGCLVQWDKNSTFKNKYPSVDLWLGINDIPSSDKLVSSLWNKKASRENQLKAHARPVFLPTDSTPRFQLTP